MNEETIKALNFEREIIVDRLQEIDDLLVAIGNSKSKLIAPEWCQECGQDQYGFYLQSFDETNAVWRCSKCETRTDQI